MLAGSLVSVKGEVVKSENAQPLGSLRGLYNPLKERQDRLPSTLFTPQRAGVRYESKVVTTRPPNPTPRLTGFYASWWRSPSRRWTRRGERNSIGSQRGSGRGSRPYLSLPTPA